MAKRTVTLPFVAFWALGIIWGSNFIYMKMAAASITPLQIVLLRVLFGFVPVALYAAARRAIRREHLRHLPHFLVMSLLATVVYYYGYAKGTSLLLSGVAGVVSGAIPLFAFVLSVMFVAEEKATVKGLAGVALGLAGVLLVGRPTGTELAATNLEGVLYMVAGSLSVGSSFVYARRFIVPLKIPAAALTTYQLGLGLIILLIITDLHQITRLSDSVHASVGMVLGLGLLGTGLAYIIYYYIVERLGAVTASSVTFVPPVVALLIGALLVGEPISAVDYLATVLIFAGVIVLRHR